ncbi:hypothetical protein J2752_000616 [Halarchaeum rubridurum]|uniref:Uncharacterized protein n=1 Tax=Halarchaeum rubridurum TaxID=489911 RepID=A0A830FSG5_9EURY|nr:hypothetical protein [Halarchaeum rubridurum]MBP1953735.1 hypothetical protein [Halarchaeum rubridurum]GGM54272.1 hypothetical protein GCM10009017_00760 [Halarchaeum rubridurum]
MPSPDADRPPEARAVAERYLRRERPLSALVVVLAVALFLAAYAATSLLPAVGVAAVLLVVARAPILTSNGTIRLRTDADPKTVAASFAGPTPPVLALQWGVADGVVPADDGATYPVSYLFGLRSIEMAVETHVSETDDGARRVELDVTANGSAWATYTATIRDDGEGTVVDVEYDAERRFGLRRVPQQLVAERYRDEALAVQGYEVVARDAHFGL